MYHNAGGRIEFLGKKKLGCAIVTDNNTHIFIQEDLKETASKGFEQGLQNALALILGLIGGGVGAYLGYLVDDDHGPKIGAGVGAGVVVVGFWVLRGLLAGNKSATVTMPAALRDDPDIANIDPKDAIDLGLTMEAMHHLVSLPHGGSTRVTLGDCVVFQRANLSVAYHGPKRKSLLAALADAGVSVEED